MGVLVINGSGVSLSSEQNKFSPDLVAKDAIAPTKSRNLGIIF